MLRIITVGLALGLMFGLSIGHVRADEQIPCWQADALVASVGGNVKRAELIARRHGYTKEQIAEAKKRCGY